MSKNQETQNDMIETESQIADDFKVARVALVGRPNAGKSTLLNSLLQSHISAVSDRPQTTRSNILGILQSHNTEGVWNGQVLLMDTPGLNLEKKVLMKRSLLMSVEEALENVDVVLWVVDSTQLRGLLREIENEKLSGDRELMWFLNHMRQNPEVKWVLVPSKVDYVNPGDLLPLIQKAQSLMPELKAFIPVIGRLPLDNKKSNLETLVDEIIKLGAHSSEPMYPQDQWIGMSEKDFVKNLVRESIFRQLWQEAPYLTDCTIDRFVEPSGTRKMNEIDATIWVSKPSLKGIVVGDGGARIRDIGKAVRERYEEVTGSPMVLRLFVKVAENWSNDPKLLKELGYAI